MEEIDLDQIGVMVVFSFLTCLTLCQVVYLD